LGSVSLAYHFTGQQWDGSRMGLKIPCYIEAKAAGSGLKGAPFEGALP